MIAEVAVPDTRCAEIHRRQRLIDDPVRVQRLIHESFRLHPSSPVAKRQALKPIKVGRFPWGAAFRPTGS